LRISVTQRGNYKQKVFYREQDRKLYLEMLKEYSRHYGVAVQAYCLMDNHVHLILTPHDATGMSRLLQRLHSEYARALHVRLRRVGHLWQARYGSTVMDEKHLWAAMVYVEQNRLRAGLVTTAEDWRWSSAQAHLTGNDQGWMDFVDWRKRFDGGSWKRCLDMGLADAMMIERIRQATRDGKPLGSDGFLEQLLQQFGVKTRKPHATPQLNQTESGASGDSANGASA
jgi:putative transposase